MTIEPSEEPRAPTERVRIRPMRRDDVAWTAQLHEQALPYGFFARLGLQFLRAYHEAFLDSPEGIALVAEREGESMGFLVGAVDVDAHRAWVVRERRRHLARLGAACLLRHPHELLRFLRTRMGRYVWALATGGRRRHGPSDEPELPLAAAVLTHVAVRSDRRRGGAGRLLVQAFEQEALARGAGRARLTTLRDDRGAEEFWRSLGWVPGKAIADDEHRLHRVLERKL